MYLQDGKLIFFKTMQELKEETGEEKLSRAIAFVMTQHKKEVTYLKLAK
jgi:Cu-processing system ATP-binding protein